MRLRTRSRARLFSKVAVTAATALGFARTPVMAQGFFFWGDRLLSSMRFQRSLARNARPREKKSPGRRPTKAARRLCATPSPRSHRWTGHSSSSPPSPTSRCQSTTIAASSRVRRSRQASPGIRRRKAFSPSSAANGSTDPTSIPARQCRSCSGSPGPASPCIFGCSAGTSGLARLHPASRRIRGEALGHDQNRRAGRDLAA